MRKYHKLARNHRCETMTNIVYFDCESRVDAEQVHHPYACAAIFRRMDRKTRAEREYWHDHLYDFWKDLDAFTRPKTHTYLFAHNAGYDFQAMSGMRHLTEMGWVATSFFERGPVFILKMQRNNRAIVVLSTTNYFVGTLASLGEAIGLPKVDIDVLNATDEEIRPYMLNDALIIERAVESFLAFVRDEDLGNIALTLAGQAFNAFRHRFMHHDILIHDNEEVARLERDAYVGGRVECFYQGTLPTENGPYYKLDVNSLYPDRMRECPVPINLKWHRKHGDLMALFHRARSKGLLVIARCTVRTATNRYPAMHERRIVYPVGTFDTVLCTDKLDCAAANGELVSISEIAVYDGALIFTDYVDYFYQRKVNTDNPLIRYFYKLFLNSLYGKLGQLAHPMKRVDDAPIDEYGCETIFNTDDTITTRRTFGGSVFEEYHSPNPLENEASNSFPAIAAHITSAASSKLHSYIETTGHEHSYYVDTDCDIVDALGYTRLLPFVDARTLGALKVEGTTEHVELFQPKEYTFGSETKRKGLSKDAKLVGERTWTTTQWPRLTGAIGGGNPNGYQNRTITKTLTMEYKKGNVLPSGRITPYLLDRYGILDVGQSEYGKDGRA